MEVLWHHWAGFDCPSTNEASLLANIIWKIPTACPSQNNTMVIGRSNLYLSNLSREEKKKSTAIEGIKGKKAVLTETLLLPRSTDEHLG